MTDYTPVDDATACILPAEVLSPCERSGAGKPATGLVRRILTFSRPAQETHEIIPVQPVVHATLQLIRATLPAMIDARARFALDPFFTAKPQGMGTALGLSVVHGIMLSHFGAVTAENELGRGPTFRLLFPVAEGKVAAAPAPAATAAGTAEGAGHDVPLRPLRRCGVRSRNATHDGLRARPAPPGHAPRLAHHARVGLRAR